FSSMMQQLQELTKYIKGKEEQEKRVDYAQFVSFESKVESKDMYYALSALGQGLSEEWIIDTGASKHICKDESCMTNVETLKDPVVICLPDGSLKTLRYKGDVVLDEKVTLFEVLLVPSFKYNLLSVMQL
ncbi:Unknown protein, partial [Striga hermonthica]